MKTPETKRTTRRLAASLAIITALATGAMLPLSAMADAVRVYDVDDYVQDGLVLHFDGIRNAGATALHDPNATTWVNLGSGGSVNDATLKEKESSDAPTGASAGSWCDKGYTFNALNYFEIGGEVSLGKAVTVQMATKYDYSAVKNAFNGKGLNWPVFFGAIGRDADDFVIFGDNIAGSTPQKLRFKFYNNTGYRPAESSPDVAQSWNGLALSAIYDGNNTRMSLSPTYNYAWMDDSRYYNNISDGTTHFAIGTGQSASAAQKQRMLVGNVYSVKLYDRVLSEEELYWNQTIDDQRYRMENPPSLDDVNVILRSIMPIGDCITNYIGKYIVADTHTFTAPATIAKGMKGYNYILKGYTVEEWNAEASAWGAAVTYSGESYTASASGGKVRVTWLYTPTLRAASNYDVDDYVQDGLVLHFDGIRNAGATVAHNSTQRTWKNLVKGQPDATFSSENGYWTDDGKGFYFEGVDKVCYAAITNPISIGPNATVQLAVNVDPSNQNNGKSANATYPCYFHAGTDSDTGIFQYLVGQYTKYLQFKHLGWTGNGVSMTQSTDDWDGRYATAIVADAKVYFTTTGADLETAGSVNRSNQQSLSAKYCWGGSPRSGTRAVLGSYYSVRVYNTALSNDELAQNRRIDEMRFHGIGDVEVVNGAVGETGETGESSLPDGVYNIETGTWTVTAEDVVDGRRYKPHLTVDTLTNGEWVQTAKLWTDSYTVDKAALGSSRIRLTWTWEIRPGLIISFH